MKNIKYIPLILAALMYGAATYFIFDGYFSIGEVITFNESFYGPLAVSIASYLYLSGSILVVGFLISDAMRKT